jgi:tetratricopeptide (TPR) repeat protein
LAIAKAAEACPEAEKLMEIAACLAPERIPLDIITPDVMSEKQREKAVAALFRVSLITHQTRDDGSLGFHVHRLVQQVTHKRLGEKIVDILPLAMRLVNEALSNDNSADNHYSWSSKLLLPHAIAILHRVPVHDKEASNTALLNFHVGGLNLAEYKYEEAEPFVARALAIVEEVHGPKHTSTVLCLERMSEVYHRQHRNAEAETLLRRSLAIREQISGQNTPGLLAPLQNLARVCSYQGRHEEAVGLYEQSIAMAERLLGSDHRLTKVMSTNYEIYKLEMSREFGS